jgi:CAAX prenyl protease-like protein
MAVPAVPLRLVSVSVVFEMNNAGVLGFISRPATGRVVPFVIFIAFIALAETIGERFAAFGVDPRWIYAARPVAVGAALWFFWRGYTELHSLAGITRRGLLAAVVSGLAVFVLWINLDFGWAAIGKSHGLDPSASSGQGLDWGLVAFRFAGLALVVPVMEELFWRSFVLRWIDRHDFLAMDPGKVSVRAIIICSALFASEHHLWLAGLIAGLVYTVIYTRSGNLWLPTISHATTNAALAVWILATGNWQFW